MRIIITGSSGYIGNNLCKALRSLNHDVMGIDKITGDNINSIGVKELIVKFKPDWIVHLAALPSILACEEHKEQATYDNVKTTEVISEAASEIGCPVMFSSSQAAKNPESSHYAWCKHESETLLNEMNSGYVLRFSNIYGGDNYAEKKSSVMAQFVKAYREGKALVANGNGSQGRDFLHLNDLLNVMIDLMDVPPSTMHTLDVGTGIATSILDIIKMFNCPYILNTNSSSVGIESNFADVIMMKLLIGYAPKPRMREWVKEITNG
jgi:nucleoside-diphosphate-sugar epimerase